MTETVRILAVDVGGGTQDILIYDSSRTIENCVKLVLPSQTQVVARRIARATAERRPLHLAGCLMGGGASGNAVELHLAEDGRHDTALLVDQRREQMLRCNFRVALTLGQLLRGEDGLLGFFRISREIHDTPSFSNAR